VSTYSCPSTNVHVLLSNVYVDAIPESDHLSESNIYLKPVTLFADTVQNRVQAVVLGGLEVTGSLWEKLLGFSSTQSGNNSQAVTDGAELGLLFLDREAVESDDSDEADARAAREERRAARRATEFAHNVHLLTHDHDYQREPAVRALHSLAWPAPRRSTGLPTSQHHTFRGIVF
jgi:hypothetical protein